MKYILSIDQGTSSSRAIVFDERGRAVKCVQKEFPQHFPQSGWVEHSPRDIWQSVLEVSTEASEGYEISAIGITNQRETTIVWDVITGEPVYNAIVWQDRRTAPYCKKLLEAGLEEKIRCKTGLLIDPYFSGTKIKWILDNVPGVRERAGRGELRFGTVDSYIVWKLTGGKIHITDPSNASRTMLLNINSLQWDEELLELMDIPVSMMPEVSSSSGVLAICDIDPLKGVPVTGIAGDQQAALFGQMCIRPGSMKNTYGTGCFLLMNCGAKPVMSKNRLLSTVAWKIGDEVSYALEGSVFVAGSVVQWLRDGLGIINSSSEVEALASSVEDNGGVYFVPALTGLGAPYWNSEARGLITGLSRGTTAGHIARAALESIAFQTMDIVDAMQKDAGMLVSELKVDGGAARNNLLMQFQADLLGCEVVRPTITETTALGAALLAGLGGGTWDSVETLSEIWRAERTFNRSCSSCDIEKKKSDWHKAVERTLL